VRAPVRRDMIAGGTAEELQNAHDKVRFRSSPDSRNAA
jgi:hypothetical protein